MTQLQCGKRQLDLSSPKVMGILNATPDSFSDGGRFVRSGQLDLDSALFQVEDMISAGVDLIDVGGESTRPGAKAVSIEEELQRVIPLIGAISSRFDVIVSVDTSTPRVMSEAAASGAGLINDVRALQREGALNAAAATGLPVCLMHMQGSPKTMQNKPSYESLIEEVTAFFNDRVAQLVEVGMDPSQILIDPGFGFGKTTDHNLQLLRRLSEFERLGLPLLIGVSRKSMFGEILGRDVNERLAGSLAAALIAAQSGARIIRVHDVRETVDVLKLWNAVALAQ
ncbi:MAG: dihydropteroate synthase [Cellvibrionaceae bacterium]